MIRRFGGKDQLLEAAVEQFSMDVTGAAASGHGTVMRALLHRRPMLLMPHGRDQNDNAARVTERGAGLMLSATAGSDDIHAALTRLLDEPAFVQAAEQLGAAIAAEAKTVSAAAELEALAAGARKRTTE